MKYPSAKENTSTPICCGKVSRDTGVLRFEVLDTGVL